MPETTIAAKKTFCTALLCLCLLLVCHPGKAQQANAILNERMVQNVVWAGKLQDKVEFLCDSTFEGRAMGTKGGAQVSFYLTDHFRRAGLLPLNGSYAKAFRSDDGSRVGHNVVGMMPGPAHGSSNTYIIVGANYDHLGSLSGNVYPGADANASGVAALTTIVEMFTSMRSLGKEFGCNVIFVAFDGKEMNLAGANSFWKMLDGGMLKDPVSGRTIGKENIKLMANIDQIGATLSPLSSGREDYLIMLGGSSLSRDRHNLLSFCNRFYWTKLELSETYYGSDNFTKVFYRLSNQRPFVDNGIPAVLFTSGITMNTYKTYDLPSTLNYEIMRKRIILIYHFLDRLAE